MEDKQIMEMVDAVMEYTVGALYDRIKFVLQSGAIDKEGIKPDNYSIPRVLVCDALRYRSEVVLPNTPECKSLFKDLQHF